ncbi:Transposon Tf2-1 polyprotein, putative [Rhizoctonia solani AG-3 Rhs1AP]|uniref:RNA-directed DNA polymerase n=1 Tax=Rhizoctonia solani AG-3 Rhs1AP TaxID=1086054 RepID=X8J8U0_9AGAM|nr:Transposon Tf2-1 polyprotein, putative [Rhizoctonia solani AG-3 Rhs1AP]
MAQVEASAGKAKERETEIVPPPSGGPSEPWRWRSDIPPPSESAESENEEPENPKTPEDRKPPVEPQSPPKRARTVTTAPAREPESSVPASSPTTARKPKIGSEPESFDGKKGGTEAKNWLRKAIAYTKANSTRFDGDGDIVFFLCNKLMGNAQAWAAPIVEAYLDDDYTNQQAFDIATFEEHFIKAFGDPDAVRAAERRIQALHQGTSKASEYTTAFETLRYELANWGNAPLMAIYRQGLRDEIKNVLAQQIPRNQPNTLSELQDFAIQMDNQLRENEEARKRSHGGGSSQKKPEATSSSRTRSGAIPKEGDENFVPPEEIERRKREDTQVKAEKFKVLIDSGATANFIHSRLVQKLNLPTTPTSAPISVTTVDGSALKTGKIYTKVNLRILLNGKWINGNFLVTNLGKRKMILGTPFLRKYNPTLDWNRNSLIWKQDESGINAESWPASIAMNAEAKELPPQYNEFSKVFGDDFYSVLPPHREYDIAIDLEEGKEPPFGPIYSMTPVESTELKNYLDEHLAKGSIRHSKSPAGAPVMFVKKSDGSLRLCVDYRKLNAITVKNRYPLPLQQDLVEKLQGAKIYTKLDLRWGYNNVRIREGDEWKTAFRTKYGHFEYLVMPFGLTNAPAAFQHFMNDLLRDLIDVSVIVYLDDILIYSKNPEEHENHVCEVLKRLRDANLYCKLSKCFFHVTTVPYLGMVITPDGISMETAKVQAVQEWPRPQTIKQIQSFLGFANFYRRFIQDYSSIARPLHDLVNSKEFKWDDKAELAFHTIKNRMSTGPVLAHPDPEQPYLIETDASGVAMGAVLSQKQKDGRYHPIAYMSKSFQGAEKNYDTHDKELMAIIAALKEWRIYLEGCKHRITILTDHRNLEYWKSARTFNRRHNRWHQELAPFDFAIAHRPGKLSEKPDALSRRSDHGETPKDTLVMLPEDHFVELNAIEPEWSLELEIKEEQGKDPSLDAVIQFLSNQPEEAPKTIREKFKRYTWIDETLFFDDRIIVPDSDDLKRRVCLQEHDHPSAGHPGRERTRERVARRFYWPGMTQWVHDYVDSCDLCQRNKPAHGRRVPAQPLPVPDKPWEWVEYDLIAKLPESEGFDSILTFTDRLTKMVHYIPCKEATDAEGMAELFLRHVWKLHGTPRITTSDRGTQFNSDFMKALYQKLDIEPRFSTAYHPQTDGQSEYANKMGEQFLRFYVDHRQTDWVKWLPLAEFSFNAAKNRQTGFSAFELNYGFTPEISARLSSSPVPAADQMASHIHEKLEEAKASLRMAREKTQDEVEDPEFEVGDKVWLNAKHIATDRPTKKLDWKRLGPYKITKQVSKVAYRLDLPKSMKIHNVFHASLLSKFIPNSIIGRDFEEPPPIITEEGEEEFEVEEIVDSRYFRNQLQYFVKWKGYPPSENKWEPWFNVENSPELIDEFHQKHPQAASKVNKPRRRLQRRS